MQVALSYGVPSGVDFSSEGARVRLAGARERPALRFRAAVRDPIPLREALGALHDVVLSDFRWRPKTGREELERWLAHWLDLHARAERRALDRARRTFLESLWAEQRAPWAVLDPVCSVHPDQVFFEAFSRDGSSYARVGLDRAGWEEAGNVVCGTTNVDFSAGLYEAIRRLRSIFRTEVTLGHDALVVQTGAAAAHKEKKVELPDGWVRGFVQIGAAFLLPALACELLPVHVHDLCRFLRLHKAKVSPRALRFELVPGRPVELVFEPWEQRMVLHGSRHEARERRIVRIWGRQRLRLLERVIPLADRFVVHLLGRGLPYFVTARSGPLDFTLGLSGWTRSDFTQTARFDALIARRGGASPPSPRPLAWLQQHHLGAADAVASGAGVPVAEVHRSLVDAAGRGLVVYDLLRGVYRSRPLLGAGPGLSGDIGGLALGHDPQQEAATALVARGVVSVLGTRRELDGTTRVLGRVAEDDDHVYQPEVALGDEGNVAKAACGCYFAKQHGLKQGLCPHQHALLRVYEE